MYSAELLKGPSNCLGPNRSPTLKEEKTTTTVGLNQQYRAIWVACSKIRRLIVSQCRRTFKWDDEALRASVEALT